MLEREAEEHYKRYLTWEVILIHCRRDQLFLAVVTFSGWSGRDTARHRKIRYLLYVSSLFTLISGRTTHSNKNC